MLDFFPPFLKPLLRYEVDFCWLNITRIELRKTTSPVTFFPSLLTCCNNLWFYNFETRNEWVLCVFVSKSTFCLQFSGRRTFTVFRLVMRGYDLVKFWNCRSWIFERRLLLGFTWLCGRKFPELKTFFGVSQIFEHASDCLSLWARWTDVQSVALWRTDSRGPPSQGCCSSLQSLQKICVFLSGTAFSLWIDGFSGFGSVGS